MVLQEHDSPSSHMVDPQFRHAHVTPVAQPAGRNDGSGTRIWLAHPIDWRRTGGTTLGSFMIGFLAENTRLQRVNHERIGPTVTGTVSLTSTVNR